MKTELSSYWLIGQDGELIPNGGSRALSCGFFSIDTSGAYVPNANEGDDYFKVDMEGNLVPK